MGSLLFLLLFLVLTVIGIALVESLFSGIGVTSRFMTGNMTSDCQERRIGEVHLAQSDGNRSTLCLWDIIFCGNNTLTVSCSFLF